MPNFGGWEILLILLVILLLFGAKRLPDTARGLGRSLRIFKSETRGLREDDDYAAQQHGEARVDTTVDREPRVIERRPLDVRPVDEEPARERPVSER